MEEFQLGRRDLPKNISSLLEESTVFWSRNVLGW